MSIDNLFSNEEFCFPEISDREMARERLLFNTTEDILIGMEDAGLNQTDLAKKLGKSKAYVSQLLDGTRNMTLKTLADISYALGAEAKVCIIRNGVDVSHQVSARRDWFKSVSADVNDNKKNYFVAITLPAPQADRATYVK
ncbi:XRE family transcriptional regulator [Cronobacter sakazakii]|uniref:helix-turn-helix transcriptional regulator n=1 Tax=Cronobacter sakazakii TaxID=28141 RepID=UPI000CF19560|nr:helix-turn-helix transcriptional regulator [Cronobacter sakazakii]PPY39320.1 XRE family transcriptional regulator [Cronobacter sakazakii]PPY52411.1 XRE family transcriptional regulator [Cronobacter sakazakii]PQY10458.1 XRE family transcriptional regulator [Cronobacter sakazakii]PQY26779.1 XRE family transcriptional regulator [Cronobacter sakazakii]